KLGAIWVTPKFDEGGTSRVTPVVHDGVMFVTAGRKVYALDARSGSRLWTYTTVAAGEDPQHRANPADENTVSDGVPNNRGVGLGEGLVYVGLKDGRVIALDEKTGALRWTRQTGANAPRNGQFTGVAPLYVGGRVLTGLANGDAYLRGRLT